MRMDDSWMDGWVEVEEVGNVSGMSEKSEMRMA
jgi:hypothetical protein